jgi:tetratricopeptide (TPR) repeat protein
VTALVEELDETEETTALAVLSRLLQLDYAWRLGMERGEADALAREATEIATRIGDLRSLALLTLLTTARPGVAEHADEWIAAAEEATRIADETGQDDLRVAVRGPGAYAYMSAGDLDAVERTAEEILEMTRDDPALGAGIVLGSPAAWGRMAKSVALRERDRPEEAEALLEEGLRIAAEQGDPETENWIRGIHCLVIADRGDTEAALALARHNCELTEQLGDVFSRSTGMNTLAYVQIAAGEHADALETIELSDRLYRDAMGTGGETEAWRSTLRARALLGLSRDEEALEEAEWAAATALRRGMGWQIPIGFHTLAQARAAVGTAGVQEALEQALETANSLGHTMTRRRIESERDALLAGAA